MNSRLEDSTNKRKFHIDLLVSPCKPLDKTKATKAGLKRVSSNTPIGKLQQRLKSMRTPQQNDNDLTYNVDKTIQDEEVKNEVSNKSFNITVLLQKLDEVKYISKTSGIEVARAVMLELPSDKGMRSIVLKSVYWLTWIEMEKSYAQWDNVELLFQRAHSIVKSNSDKVAISKAYEIYKEETNITLNTTMDKIDDRYAQ
jgi:hypothetical protein